MVTNTNDSGTDSLRQAILDANATVGADLIAFNIGSDGVQTIAPTSALPTITDPVTIDGTTQPGFVRSPIIELSGASAGGGVSGLTIAAADCTIRGLIVNRFGGNGILINGAAATGNIIQGNYIGTDATGTTSLGNLNTGISINTGANHSLIGGTVEAARNVISGNGINYSANIRIESGSHDITIQGNTIGPDITGTVDLGNGFGIRIIDSWAVLVGGVVAGAGNLISGNVTGVEIVGTAAANNRVQGNRIGTDVTGTVALGNFTGVSLGDGAHDNVVGTDGDGFEDAREGNLISGNTEGGLGSGGVFLYGAGTRDNAVAGNLIGTDFTGRIALPNSWGVGILSGPSHNRIGTNADGIADDLERNIISGNAGGVVVNTVLGHPVATEENVIAGNYIGTDITGTENLGNRGAGVAVSVHGYGEGTPGPRGTIIGGTNPVQRNIISGNGGYGILLSQAAETIIQGNYVGTDVTGTVAFPNATGAPGGPPNGILVASSSHTLIGGGTPGSGNLISGNNGYGLAIWYDGSEHNRVQGNLIGTDVTGTLALANTGGGVSAAVGSRLSVIGTDGDGVNDAHEGNLISGNRSPDSPYTWGLGVGNQSIVAGNKIGTDITGTFAIPNATGMIVGGFGSRIGTNADGVSDELERNIISGNLYSGAGFGSANNHVFAGNYVGVDVNGDPLGNGGGIEIGSAHNILIGSNADGVRDDVERNVISANHGVGVWIHGAGTDINTSNNVVAGNYIGVGVDGLTDRGNGVHGIWMSHGSRDALIGGASSSARNVISGNGGSGIRIDDSYDHRVQGNYIGVDRTGVSALPNAQDGVHIFSYYYTGADGLLTTRNQIGGTAPGEGNLISGNQQSGVAINGDFANNNVVQGNYIGTDVSGTLDLGNSGDGVRIDNSPSNTIGGVTAGARNIISGNNSDGVELRGPAASGNLILGNYIGTDVSGALDLGNSANGVFFEYAPNNTIGGTTASARNVISGNDFCGLTILGGISSGNLVLGNFIGTDVTGTLDLGNSSNGVFINSASNNTIGGTTAGARNVISGNDSDGIGIFLDGASGNLVLGNFIGTDVTGTADLGNNLNGVSILLGASYNTIGGTEVGAGNVIAHNNAGVVILGPTSVGNSIRGNSIHSNAGLGIDLGSDGVTANDPLDPDTGPNNLQNFPEISLFHSGTSTRVAGTLNGLANTTFTLEFFANAVADPSGYGEGQRFLGSAVVSTDAGGNASFDVTLPGASSTGEVVTATATDPNGNTSEFSGVRTVTVRPVQIDIKPRSFPNSINLNSEGLLPVAVLTTTDFNAVTVDASDLSRVRFGDVSRSARVSPRSSQLDDVDGDGDTDRVFFFSIPQIRASGALVGSSTQAELTAFTTGGTAIRGTDSVRIVSGTPLLAASAGTGVASGEALTPAHLAPILAEARSRWQWAGVDSGSLAALNELDVQITDLTGNYLGLADGNTIWIDVNAAGWGWFVDATPSDDFEFLAPGDQGEQDRMDLLSVVMHELGHVLGLAHEDEGVMQEKLTSGTRQTLQNIAERDWLLAMQATLADLANETTLVKRRRN